ncbi:hypothetical protein E2P81_ATG03506 [Venturia nashicola]|nr:hypothetical protein E2P81_ATG03506 [Venturia nashicola]
MHLQVTLAFPGMATQNVGSRKPRPACFAEIVFLVVVCIDSAIGISQCSALAKVRLHNEHRWVRPEFDLAEFRISHMDLNQLVRKVAQEERALQEMVGEAIPDATDVRAQRSSRSTGEMRF